MAPSGTYSHLMQCATQPETERPGGNPANWAQELTPHVVIAGYPSSLERLGLPIVVSKCCQCIHEIAGTESFRGRTETRVEQLIGKNAAAGFRGNRRGLQI